MTSVTVATLMTSSKEDVVSVLGGIYEHSPWVAEAFYTSHVDGTTADSNAIENVRQLFDILSSIVDAATREQKLQLLRAHPDLAAKVEKLKTLTKESQEEQSKAGLDTLTDEERVRFLSLNESYRVKFGFPFILAVRNATKYTVISAVEGRISNTPEEEFVSALGQVHKIAWMRLLGAIDYPNPAGFLTCHVLDTANGCPADNMRIQLHRLSPPDAAGLIAEFRTNDDGRLPGGPALKGSDFQVGVYEWTFYVGDYFARKNTTTTGTPFLDEIPLRFGIDDPTEHYHVPLLVSPWSFSTYRGS
mmetsp:Transcript_21040/g.42954  ORF Transcript_21040/g.42954 Transcript_21040/m.42954 type:complete len:303 (-) Transcript_21040:112-1020(-)